MSHLQGEARARFVRQMFGRIASRYDLLNRIMTLGRDQGWRREAVRRLELPANGIVLDLGAGTGDLAFEALRQRPESLVVAADFTPEMIAVGRRRPGGDRIGWIIADALQLPFADGVFHGVISGFLLRNVGDVQRALTEQYRVLRPPRRGRDGGRIVSLETTPPKRGLLRPLINFHFHQVIPRLGAWISGDPEAYRYLPSTTEGFVTAEALLARMAAVGFKAAGFVRRMFGTVAIHWAQRVGRVTPARKAHQR